MRTLFFHAFVLLFAAAPLHTFAQEEKNEGVPIGNLKLGDRPYLSITPEPVSARYSETVVPVKDYAVSGASPTLEHLIKERLSGLFQTPGLESKGQTLRIVCVLSKGDAASKSPQEREHYDLAVEAGSSGVEAKIASLSERGLAYGVISLQQLLIERNNQRWVRLAVIGDQPTIPVRLIKRASGYWLNQALSYKLNGGSLPMSLKEDGGIGMAESSIKKLLNECDGKYLDMMAMVNMGNVYRGDQGYQDRVVEGFKSLAKWGMSQIAIMNDDKMTLLDVEGRKRYGSYVAAQLDYLDKINAAVHEVKPDVPVAFMPNFYYGHEFYEPYAREMRGKMPKDVALFWAGPGTPGPDLKMDELKKVAVDSGADKLWIYTNWPQCKAPYWSDNLGPIRNHDFGDGKLVKLVTISTSTLPEPLPSSFITICDLLWNPAAYNPDRSLRLATKELVDPESYDAFLKLFQFVDKNAPIADVHGLSPMYGSADAAERKQIIEKRSAALDPLIAACLETPAGKIKGPVRSMLEAMAGKRDSYLKKLKATEAAEQENPTTKAIVCPYVDKAPKLSGKADESDWKNAVTAGGFTNLNGTKAAPQQTTLKLLRTGDALYLRIRCEEPHLDAPEMFKTGDTYPLALSAHSAGFLWWAEGIEVFLDPKRDGQKVFQVIVNPWGLVECFSYSRGGYGYYNLIDKRRESWKIDGIINKGDNAIEYELRLPFTMFGEEPKGTWGFNVARDRLIRAGDGIKYTTWTPLTWGFQDAKNFGKMTFGQKPEVGK